MKRCAFLVGVLLSPALIAADIPSPAVVSAEFIFETAPFKSCHASTLVETKSGLVAAWFGGTHEGAGDVKIWVAKNANGRWSDPKEVAHAVPFKQEHIDPNVQELPRTNSCWNPVLFRPTVGSLMLFYKIGTSPSLWSGMLRTSTDDGESWSDEKPLPQDVLGPIKNKPVQLANGDIISPSSTESYAMGSNWRARFEISSDNGKTWRIVDPPEDKAGKKGKPLNAIQPSILMLNGRLAAVGRTREGSIFETFSNDNGASWTPLSLTQLPNPNSGTDAVTLKDGRHVLVYNHTAKGRSPLNVAVSKDGIEWSAALVLESEPGEYSYPCVIQTSDEKIHIAYTWHRSKIKHVVLDPKKLELTPMVDGAWPK